MTKRSPLARLDDMLQAILGIEDMVRPLDVAAFESNFMARKAVERCIEIISEASRHIPNELIAQHPQIPWSDIRTIGNRLRHEYDRVDDLIIWKTATASMPELKPVIAAMIAALESDGDHTSAN